jgi:undecaprenyl-diphosphatase
MSQLQAILLAAIQGVTELFPVSSLGHAVILPRLLHWRIDQQSPGFLPFLVMLHVGTAAALLIYFGREWRDILLAVIGAVPLRERIEGRQLFMKIVLGTLPAVILGFVFEKALRHLFGSPELVALALAVNGAVLLLTEKLKMKVKDAGKSYLDELTYGKILFIGICQAAALIPGLSRSGLTIGAGLISGLGHEESARFSFLLAAPIILGAAVLEVPKLQTTTNGIGFGISLMGGVVAGLTAYASIAFLMAFFRKHEFDGLRPFAFYCIGAGILAFAAFLAGFA